MADTIPHAVSDDFAVADMATDTMMLRANVSDEMKQTPEFAAFVMQVRAVHAQHNAEIRWLRNMLHKHT